jgi:CelD/BcsL family acetyltransferase involved in cellulose biosynthesis
MTMTATFESRSAPLRAGSGAIEVGCVDVIRNMVQAESVWRSCESDGYLTTPYQRFDLLNAWQRNVGEHEGVAPFIVVVRDRKGSVLLVLPLAIKRENGACVARFLGGKHTTFNFGLWRGDFAATATKDDFRAILSAVAAGGVDVLAVTQQPRRWQDIANPFLMYPSQLSPNDCPLLKLAPGDQCEQNISASFRKRFRSKARKLQTLPGFRYYVASTDEDINRLLDAFFVIKPQRMAAQNLPNIFADPGVESFVRDACLAKVSGGGRAIAIHALECDEEMLAVFAGVVDNHRFSMMFNTYTMSENARQSPGVVLLCNIIDSYAAQGYADIDLGIGTEDYKRQVCKDDEPIFDSFIAFTARGRLAALGMSSLTRAKRIVKHNPALKQIAQRLRAKLRY